MEGTFWPVRKAIVSRGNCGSQDGKEAWGVVKSSQEARLETRRVTDGHVHTLDLTPTPPNSLTGFVSSPESNTSSNSYLF